MKKVMTIAGSDSGAGAGIQADIKTFAALKVYGVSVITAVTAQNTQEVSGFHPVPVELVGMQIDTVLRDITVDAVKTGMLANARIIDTVAERLTRHQVANIVVDPVLAATSGDALTGGSWEDVVRAFREVMLPLATVVTPNIPEAEALTGIEIDSPEDMKNAAERICRLGSPNVVVKGGHLKGDEAVDILFDGCEFTEYRAPKITGRSVHGTGCTFASALAAGLAKGLPVREAVAAAKQYIQAALEQGFAVGHGSMVAHHFAGYYRFQE